MLPDPVELHLGSSPHNFSLGQPIGGTEYVPGAVLYTGQKNRVYEASHPDFGAVAIKLFGEPDLQTSESVSRELYVHRMMSDDPNHTSVVDMGIAEGLGGIDVRFLAIEFAKDGDLFSFVGKDGLDNDKAVQAMLRMNRAIRALHSLGIVNGDVKPNNLLVRDWATNDFVASDLGTTRAIGESVIQPISLPDFARETVGDVDPDLDRFAEMHYSLTARQSVMGTLETTAPETLEYKPIAPAADVFGEGASLYYAVTAETPFPTTTVKAHYEAVNEGPVAPNDIGARISAGLNELIVNCLDANPSNRPTTEQVEDSLLAMT